MLHPQSLSRVPNFYKLIHYLEYLVAFSAPAGAQVQNWRHLLGHAPPCIDTRVADAWLNHPSVRRALHAEPASDIGEWTVCTDKITYVHDTGSMIPIHRSLTQVIRF